MDVCGFIAHVADNDLVFISVELAYLACFTVRALPGESLNEVSIQRRLVASTVKYLFAFAALH
jgi:hypothetical protein